MTQTIIEIQNVQKSYGSVEVLKGISLDVPLGQVVALLGPSGSGKSTLLRCINHLETINGGQIRVNGELIGYEERGERLHELSDKRIARQRRAIGMVFQSFNLFRHMTVLRNVMTGPVDVLGKSREDAEAKALELLAMVGLPEKAHAYPNELSGGQQQRVAIARTLAMDPKVLLLDEPTSALDPELSKEVISTIRGLADLGYTMMIATHEMSIASGFCDRAVFMADGHVVEDRPAAEFFAAPREARTRQFLDHYAETAH
jgi:polar amino acid transport system ATP-binding protein